MSVELNQDIGGKILILDLTGKLITDDYETFTPVIEREVKRHGKVRLLVRLHDFHGWSIGALWEDIKFDFKHFNHIERLAIVGEKSWEFGMTVFCKPFTTAKVRYFDRSVEEDALNWVYEGFQQPVATTASR